MHAAEASGKAGGKTDPLVAMHLALKIMIVKT